ncbi:MAG: putative selenium-dependent hydroxylase accessory protein YqeC [Oscillospiraceae bacterium]|nr:putative selenium-dependent hydroxylase accessory protein YqeC [Oscillospiraceae bacterium]
MDLEQGLNIRPGVTAVIGGGGKTTLLRVLGEALAQRGERALLCTTAKFLPFPGLENLVSPTEEDIQATFRRHHLIAAGAPVPGTGKLAGLELPMARLAALADYVLVEADGSAGRPMKAHAPHEPVIPAEANQTVLVIGASGFGQPIFQAAHRPERYAALAGVSLDAEVTPEIAAAVIDAEGFADRVLVNQVETAEQIAAARRLEELLACPVLSSALKGEGV